MFFHLDRIPNHQLSKPFPALYSVKWRAEQILKNRSKDCIDIAAAALEDRIAEFKEELTKENTAKYISERASVLFTDGGWELDYLPLSDQEYWDGHRPPVSHGEILYLLENWPAYADAQPDFPSVDDIEDLDALHDVLCSGFPYDDIEGFSGATEAELYAVLALMKLEDAALHIRVSRGEHESGGTVSATKQADRHVRAANCVVEAMETICYAQRNLSDARLAKMREEMQQQIVKAARAEVARAGGKARHGAGNEAREWVWTEWQKYRADYDDNKSEFARHYMALLRDRFVTRKGTPLRITDKTIREVWLAESPNPGSHKGTGAQ